MSLARDGLLGAGLLTSTAAAATTATAALAQGVFGFVEEAGHGCGLFCCCGRFVLYVDVVRKLSREKKWGTGGMRVLYACEPASGLPPRPGERVVYRACVA